MSVVVYTHPRPKLVAELPVQHLRATVEYTPGVRSSDRDTVSLEPIYAADEPTYREYFGKATGSVQDHPVSDMARIVVTAKRVIICAYESLKPAGEIVVVSIDREDLKPVTELPPPKRRKPACVTIVAPGVDLRITLPGNRNARLVSDLQPEASAELGAEAHARRQARKDVDEQRRLREINEHAAAARRRREDEEARAAEASLRRDIKHGSLAAVEALGNLLRDRPGREGEAEQLLIRAWEQGRSSSARAAVIELLGKDRRWDEVERLCRPAAELGSPDDLIDLAIAVSRQDGREVEAEALFRSALRQDIQPGAALLNLGEIAHRSGRVDEAVELLSQAADHGQRREAAMAIVKIIEDGPRDAEVDAWYEVATEAGDASAPAYLARRQWSRGELDDLETLYRLAIERGHGPAPCVELACLLRIREPDRIEEATALLHDALRQQIRWEVFDSVVRQAVVHRPAAIWVLLTAVSSIEGLPRSNACTSEEYLGSVLDRAARMLHDAGRGSESVTMCRQVVDHGRREFLPRLARELARQGRYAEAKRRYLECLEGDLDQVNTLVGLGLIAASEHDVEAAVTWLEQAIDAGDQRIAPRRLALLLADGPRDAEVGDLYRRACEAGDHASAILLARRLWSRGEPAEVEQLYRRVIASGREDLRLELACALHDLGPDHEASAEATLRDALARAPGVDEIRDTARLDHVPASTSLWLLRSVSELCADLPIEHPCAEPLFRARVLVLYGLALRRAARHDEAWTATQSAVDLGYVAAHAYLGSFCEDDGDIPEAVRHLELATQAEATWPLLDLASLHHRLGDVPATQVVISRVAARYSPGEFADVARTMREHGDAELAELFLRAGLAHGDPTTATALGSVLVERPDATEEAVDLLRRGLDGGDGSAAAVLGDLHRQRGDLEAAAAAYRRGVALADAQSMHRLGLLLVETDELAEAEEMLALAVEHGEHSADRALEDVRTARAAKADAGSGLPATSAPDLGQARPPDASEPVRYKPRTQKEKIDLLRETVRSTVAEFGPDHDETLAARTALARELKDAGDKPGVVTERRELAAARERVLGPVHPKTLTARHNLAFALGEAGEIYAAIAAYRAVLALRPADDPELDITRWNLALNLCEAGQMVEGIALLRVVIAERDEQLGPGDDDTLASRRALARNLGRVGDYSAAIETLRLAREIVAERQPGNDDWLKRLGDDLAVWLIEAGRPADGTSPASTVPDSEKFAVRLRRVRRLVRMGLRNTAMKSCRRLLADQLRHYGPDHPEPLATRQVLVDLIEARGVIGAAVDAYRLQLAAQLRVVDAHDPVLDVTRVRLAYWLGLAGWSGESTAMYRLGLESDSRRITDKTAAYVDRTEECFVIDVPAHSFRASLRTVTVRLRRLLGALLIVLGTLASPIAVWIAVLRIFDALPGDGDAHALNWVPSRVRPYLLFIWLGAVGLVLLRRLGLRLVRADRRRVLFLRRFGDTAATATITDATLRIGASWRFLTLDDTKVAPIPISKRLTIMGVIGNVIGFLFDAAGTYGGRFLKAVAKFAGWCAAIATAPLLIFSSGSPEDRLRSALAFHGFFGSIAGFFLTVLVICGVVCLLGAVILMATLVLYPAIHTLDGVLKAILDVGERAVIKITSGTDIARTELRLKRSTSQVIANRLSVCQVETAVWRETVVALAHRCDIALLDLSDVSVNVMWEIERLEHLRIRTVLVGGATQIAHLAESWPTLDRPLRSFLADRRVLVYTPDPRGRRRFRTALESALYHAARNRVDSREP